MLRKLHLLQCEPVFLFLGPASRLEESPASNNNISPTTSLTTLHSPTNQPTSLSCLIQALRHQLKITAALLLQYCVGILIRSKQLLTPQTTPCNTIHQHSYSIFLFFSLHTLQESVAYGFADGAICYYPLRDLRFHISSWSKMIPRSVRVVVVVQKTASLAGPTGDLILWFTVFPLRLLLLHLFILPYISPSLSSLTFLPLFFTSLPSSPSLPSLTFLPLSSFFLSILLVLHVHLSLLPSACFCIPLFLGLCMSPHQDQMYLRAQNPGCHHFTWCFLRVDLEIQSREFRATEVYICVKIKFFTVWCFEFKYKETSRKTKDACA